MSGLFTFLKNIISNEDFLREAQGASPFFTRRRKLSLPLLVITLLRFTRSGIQIEMDRLFDYLSTANDKVETYSKSAFSQFRKKLNVNSLVYLNQQILHYNQEHTVTKTWKNYQLIAIDGSYLNLPNTDELAKYYGVHPNQYERCVAARVSVAYDLCNRLVLDAMITPLNKGERTLAEAQISRLALHSQQIFVFDRGYPSLHLFKQLIDSGVKFCMRLSTAWLDINKAMKNQNDINYSFKKGYRYKHNAKWCFLENEISGLRIVKIQLSSGEQEILITNLTDRDAFKHEDMKQLYHMRWGIEEVIKHIKQVAQIEYFSGKTQQAIEQDFFARIAMVNICSIIEMQELKPVLDQKNKCKQNKYVQQTNRTQVYAKVKDYLLDILWGKNGNKVINKMLLFLHKCYDIVRPDRHFVRNINTIKRKKTLQYKAT